ncbi:MAG: patatin-like phospholipase family protein [Mucilaginibacter sp.]
MDIVTDLSSQAVSFIVILQDLCREQPGVDLKDDTTQYFYQIAGELEPEWEIIAADLKQNISENTWISNRETFKNLSLTRFLETSIGVVGWYLDFYKNGEQLNDPPTVSLGINSSPYEWREGIRYILFADTEQRLKLVEELHYMPLQIVLALGGGKLCSYDQRLYQVWDPDDKLNTVSQDDITNWSNWWTDDYKERKRSDVAFELLKNDELLLKRLNEENIPVPFESILHDELNEIEHSREKRLKVYKTRETLNGFESCIFRPDEPIAAVAIDDCIARREGKGSHYYSVSNAFSTGAGVTGERIFSKKETNDPLKRAKSLGLYGLAFSGGGIRSATFNLGILQKLAEKGLLEKFDYLSTVSGGGYIGSWFASWVSRGGSIAKVIDRLNPEKSADPQGEDVRPIRWLRMFSNYLSPNASIMSADAWTMGITWLRNTLINQVILLLLLCSALFGVEFVFYSWVHFASPQNAYSPCLSSGSITCWWVAVWSTGVFLPASVFAGLGMRAYNNNPPGSPFSREKNTLLAFLLIGWGLLSAFIVSLWLFANSLPQYNLITKTEKLWPAGAVGFLCLIIVAIMGRYGSLSKKHWIPIILSSLVAAATGAVLLACSWQLFETIKHLCIGYGFRYKIGFMVALPLILEVISVIVVTRMALLGKIFPDERREWWGRVGAIVHRFMFIWILTSAAILLLPEIPEPFSGKNSWGSWAIASMGGWSVVVGYAVKLAFNSKTSGDKPVNGSLSAKELFVRLAPYLFALGFLIIGSYITHHLFQRVYAIDGLKAHPTLIGLGLCLLIGGVTVLISWRIGVNEFSLHHFYCNRLVRAYLGATRRRKDREQSVNNFTNFDKLDDLKLTCLTTSKGYTGPFMILNTALNATVVTDELDRQDRKAESFIFTSKYCGFDCSRTRAAARSAKKSYDYAFRPTGQYSQPSGPDLGTAMAISGAAVNPNMGYHSSPGTAFLLTVFNVRLGRWIGNPRKSYWRESDPRFGLAYLLSDLVGKSSAKSNFVCLSDGGHFDNMGIYELIRRRCKTILLCDAEEDDDASCEGLSNAIRRCRIDFGVEIDINIRPITTKNAMNFSNRHFVTGTIWYPGDAFGKPSGILTYVKTSLTDTESVDVREYFIENKEFPQQSTGDQFFDESQFESYRKLGYLSLP